MNVKDLIEGYYAGTLSDTDEERLEMLMISGHPDSPEQERMLYLGITNLPKSTAPARNIKKIVWRITSVAATLAIIVSLGYYTYIERQRQMVTQQEILELAMGNFGKALHKSDTTREQLASILRVITTDTTSTEEEENHNSEEI